MRLEGRHGVIGIQGITKKLPPPSRVEADVYINKIIDDHPYLVRVRDISVSGMYIYNLIEPKQCSSQGLALNGAARCDDTIWAVDRLVRSEDGSDTEGCAVEFVRMGERDRH